MRTLLLAVALAACAPAATHVLDTVYLSDGVSKPPCGGNIVIEGYQRDANGKTALTGAVTAPIRTDGTVDFYLEGGPNTSFRATVYLLRADCKSQGSSYQEPPWVVPITPSAVTIRSIRGVTAVPRTTVPWQQIGFGGIADGCFALLGGVPSSFNCAALAAGKTWSQLTLYTWSQM